MEENVVLNVLSMLSHLLHLVTCMDDFPQSPRFLLLPRLPGSTRFAVQAWHIHTVVLIVVPTGKRLASSGGLVAPGQVGCLTLGKCGTLLGWHEVLKDFIARKLANKIMLEPCLD